MAICTAHRTNGEPCRAHAIRGGSVCVAHGGAAPQVKHKAAERMREVASGGLELLNSKITGKSRDMDGKTTLEVVVKLTQLADALEGHGQGPQGDGSVSVHVHMAE